MAFLCVKCKEDVPNHSKAVQCSVCDGWIHISCADVTNELYECAKRSSSSVLAFICNSCQPSVNSLRREAGLPPLSPVVTGTKASPELLHPFSQTPYFSASIASHDTPITRALCSPIPMTSNTVIVRLFDDNEMLNNSHSFNETGQQGCEEIPLGSRPLLQSLESKLEILAESLKQTKENNETNWSKVENELNCLNEYLALSIPGPLAAQKALQLSDQAIKEAANDLVDKRQRDSRIILWGFFSSASSPTETAKNILSATVPLNVLDSMYAEWFRSKKTRRPVGLLVSFTCSTYAMRTLENASHILESCPEVNWITQDKSLKTRRSETAPTSTNPAKTQYVDAPDWKLDNNPQVVLTNYSVPGPRMDEPAHRSSSCNSSKDWSLQEIVITDSAHGCTSKRDNSVEHSYSEPLTIPSQSSTNSAATSTTPQRHSNSIPGHVSSTEKRSDVLFTEIVGGQTPRKQPHQADDTIAAQPSPVDLDDPLSPHLPSENLPKKPVSKKRSQRKKTKSNNNHKSYFLPYSRIQANAKVGLLGDLTNLKTQSTVPTRNTHPPTADKDRKPPILTPQAGAAHSGYPNNKPQTRNGQAKSSVTTGFTVQRPNPVQVIHLPKYSLGPAHLPQGQKYPAGKGYVQRRTTDSKAKPWFVGRKALPERNFHGPSGNHRPPEHNFQWSKNFQKTPVFQRKLARDPPNRRRRTPLHFPRQALPTVPHAAAQQLRGAIDPRPLMETLSTLLQSLLRETVIPKRQ